MKESLRQRPRECKRYKQTDASWPFQILKWWETEGYKQSGEDKDIPFISLLPTETYALAQRRP